MKMKLSLIDTIKFSGEINHVKWIKEQAQLYAEGVINPITKACSSAYHNKKFKVPGAYGSAATVWSKRQGSILLIECSAAKFLTGHNVFGDDDLPRLVTAIFKAVCRHLGIKPTSNEKSAIKNGNVRLYRLDLATHIKLPTHIAVCDFIQALKTQLVFTRRSFSTYADQSIYIDQGSDMKSTKFYDKWEELLFHKLPNSLPDKEFIKNHAKNMLRIEMTFRNRFLKDSGMSIVSDFNIKQAQNIIKDEIFSLNLTDQSLLQGNHKYKLGGLKNCLLALHSSGFNLKKLFNERQIKEHSKEIFKKTGINILTPSSAIKFSMIPVKKYLAKLDF